MKVATRVLEGQSNMGGERVGMTIDQSALAHIMAVLTDLYSDPELAVIREYSTNAFDSHVEAGVTRPIEVTLPSPLSPFLRIRDFGIGLDADGIRDVYSQYGTSTKRDSNDVVGMLGLGCKSALTYSDQFTLTGIKDGLMTQVSVSRDEDGSGSMTIVAQHPTDDEQGVEVIIPVKRHNAFEAKAYEFFKFWDTDRVLINGEKPTKVDGVWLNDSLCLISGSTQSYVVMGNVAYPIPDEHDPTPQPQNRYGYRNHATVAYVPIGDVQFTPSREALQMTKLTKDTLARIKQDVANLLQKSMQDQITNAPTAKEARRITNEGRALGVALDFTYKGFTVVDTLNRVDPTRANVRPDHYGPDKTFLIAGADSYRRKSGERSLQASLDAAYNRDTVWFKNFENVELSSTMREKLRAWAARESVSIESARLVLAKSYSAEELFWLDGNTIHDWEDVAAIKLAKKERTLDSGRPRGSYAGRQDGTWSEKIVADTIDTSKPILWVRGNHYSVSSEPEMRAQIIPDDATIITLPANRIDKFCRDFPTAKKFSDYGKEYVANYFKKMSPEVLAAVSFQTLGKDATKLAVLDPERVDDPDMKAAIKLAKTNVNAALSQINTFKRFFYGVTDSIKLPKNPADKYPLLPYEMTKNTFEHIYLYLNAAYAAGRSA